MDPYYVSLNQVNFDKQTLGDNVDEIESFANIVSYDDDFKSNNSYPIESKKIHFENDNGLYLQQERLAYLKDNMQYLHAVLNKTEDGCSPKVIFHSDMLPNSFRAFTETTDGLNFQETNISTASFNESVSAVDIVMRSNEADANKSAALDHQMMTRRAFQLNDHPTPPPHTQHKKKSQKQNIVQVLVHNQANMSSNQNEITAKSNGLLSNKNEATMNYKELPYIQNETSLIKTNEMTSNQNETSLLKSNEMTSNQSGVMIKSKVTLSSHNEAIIKSNELPSNQNVIATLINHPVNEQTSKYDLAVHENIKKLENCLSTMSGTVDIDNNVLHVNTLVYAETHDQKMNESDGFKSKELERAHLIGQLEMLEMELKLVLTDRSTLKSKVASLEEQLKIFGSTTEDRDALCIDLETMRINQSRLEGVIVEAHTLLTDRDLEIQQLSTTIQQIAEERDILLLQITESRRSVESREAISIDLKAKITELYIELQLANQKTSLVDNQVSTIEGELKAANAAKLWFKEQLEQSERDLAELRTELTTVRGKHIQRGTELEKCKAELARSKRLVVDTEQRLLSEKQMLVAYLERIESEMMQRDAQLDAANRTYIQVIERKPDENDVEIKKEETKSLNTDSSAKLTELETIKSNLEKRIIHYEQVLKQREDSEKENEEKIIVLDGELNKFRDQLEAKNRLINNLQRKEQTLEADLLRIGEEKKFIDGSMVQLKSDLKLIEQNFSSMKEDLRKKQILNDKLTTQVNLLVHELELSKSQKHKFKLSGIENLVEIPVVATFNIPTSNLNDSGVQTSGEGEEVEQRAIKYHETMTTNQNMVSSSHQQKMNHSETQTGDINKNEILIFPFSKDFKWSTASIQTERRDYLTAGVQTTVDLIGAKQFKESSVNTEAYETLTVVKQMSDIAIETSDVYRKKKKVPTATLR